MAARTMAPRSVSDQAFLNLKQLWRRVPVQPLIAMLLVLVLPVQQAVAFWPWNIRLVFSSPFDETHESITNSAMKELASEFFSITSLTSSMKSAIAETIEWNASVDKNQKDGFWHFDGESFLAGRDRAVAFKNTIIDQLRTSDDGSAARQSLGQVLHTIQDFYSHSNWVELGKASPNTAITQTGPLTFSGAAERTCKDNLIFPGTSGQLVTANLTSGYYKGENEIKPIPDPGKCNHGGLLEGLFTDGINKDVSNLDFSPHAVNHLTAANLAKEASKQFLRDIKSTPGVTLGQMKRLFGIELTLAIAIDTTGSMGSIINSVKDQAIAMVDARLGTPLEPTKYVLAPFNDPSVPPAMSFSDPAAFKSAISSLFASGGGDCPELAVGGMLQALGKSGKGGDLFMFTDASAKDSSSVGAALTLAADKNITVHAPLFGSCSPIDPAYISLTSATGGEYFLLSPAEAGSVAKLADLLVRPNKVNILIIDDVLTGSPKEFTVPVDSTLSRVTFVVSGTTATTIKRPNGSTVLGSDPDVTSVALSSGLLMSVSSPAVGPWTLSLNGLGSISLRASGESQLDLESFRFLEPAGRPGHGGYYPISGQPILGQTYLASAQLSTGLADSFSFRSAAGAVLQPLSLTKGLGNSADTYTGSAVLPSTGFKVYVTGTDPGGRPFQRVRAITVQSEPIQIVAPAPSGLKAGQASTLEFTAKNFGSADVFRILATDNKGYLRLVSPATVALGSGEDKPFAITLMPPQSALAGDSTVLTVTLESTTNSAVRNGISIAVVVTEGFVVDHEPPKLVVVASPQLLWPADHKMQEIQIVLQVSDNLDPSPVVQFESITSNENQDQLGDGHTSPDIQRDATGRIFLRAERSGLGTDRVYTITYSARDKSGNTAFATATVRVPHDQGR